VSPAIASEAGPSGAKPAQARVRRIPIRRRPMPCPHCDAELLDPELAAAPSPACPSCGHALQPVQVAGFGRRTLAGAVDLGILALTAGPLAYGIHRIADPTPIAAGAQGLDLALSLASAEFGLLLTRAGPFLVFACLYVMVSLIWTGRTLGQRLLSMRVIDRHGQPPGPLAALVRTLAQLLGTLAAALGPLWMAIDSERRAVHDLVAGTYVVRSA
jgi:uncharacterized RDD family membrane protein YckC